MNALLRLAYSGAGELASWLARVAPAGDGKVARSLAARRGVVERFEAWARRERDLTRPLLWMHAPSVGEGLQARPILELARARQPQLQLAYTFFSPSAERFARGLDVDFADYLPFDAADDIKRVLAALAPTALVFSKLDLWPVLSAEAKARGVPVGLVSGTVSPGSSRRGGLARALLVDSYHRLDAVGAISAEDAERLVALGVRAAAIRVTGDTRYDQVWDRAQRVDRSAGLAGALASDRPTLVAGSTWPSDEAVLLDAWREIRRTVENARLIIAPHEPTATHLAPIARWAAAAGLSLSRLDAPGAGDDDVILVDRVGVLGDLYALATAAYVGGGFHGAGLHSVLEPAAFGAPVSFGPRFDNSRDARLLIEAQAGISVRDAAELARTLLDWLGEPSTARAAGVRARAVVESGLGAAERSYALVGELLEAGTGNREPGTGDGRR